MSGAQINEGVQVAGAIVSTVFPQMGVFVSLAEQGLPVAEEMFTAAQSWWETVGSQVTVAQAQLASAIANAEAIDLAAHG
jgi:hypothetical protein